MTTKSIAVATAAAIAMLRYRAQLSAFDLPSQRQLPLPACIQPRLYTSVASCSKSGTHRARAHFRE